MRPADFPKRRLFLAALLFLLSAGTCSAADSERWSRIADTVFHHLTKENGLPDIVVTAIEEDGDGFLWVGTQGGLARWDGYRFRTYLPDRNDPESLPAEWVQTLHRDEGGRLWIGTAAGGLARYDREHDRFHHIEVGQNGISHAGVEAIADDGAGGVWIATDGGLDHLNGQGAALGHFLTGTPVYALLRDRDGVIWAGTAGGALRQAAGGEFAPLALPSSDIRALFQDGAGRLWIGTRNQGAYLLSPERGTAQAVAGTDKSWIVSIIEAGPGEIWLGTNSQGILAVTPATGRVDDLRHDDKRISSLADDTIFALHRDRAGLLWVGSYRGLSRHDSAPAAILPLFGNSDRPNGVSDRDVRSIHALPDGRVLLGFGAAGGIDIFDPEKGRLSALRPDPARPSAALPADTVSSAARAPDGGVYIGTFRGLYHLGADGREVKRLKIQGRSEDAGVQCLHFDGSELWVGGREDGVWRINPSSGAVLQRLQGDQLTDARIRVIAPDRTGGMWIATVKGVNRLDLASGAIEHILPDETDPKSLSAEFTDSLLFDRKGRVWIATARGVDVLEGRDAQSRPRFRQISTAQGLPHNIVYMLLEDGKGRIWASTESGLAMIDPESFAVHALREAEGVPFPDGFWSSSGDKTAGGDLLFGAQGGLAVIRPDNVAEWRYQPPVAVTDVRVGGHPAEAGAPLIIKPRANSLAVEFSALDYSAPARNRYAYWLEGFDQGWVETDWSRRLAAYTNLPPGRYTLHLRGTNRDGVIAEKTLDLPVQVLPTWYQTVWFRILAALSALFAVALLVKSRTAYLRHRQILLESQVAERTAAVTNLLDNSGQGFLSLGKDLVVAPEYSAACETMLGCVPAGHKADLVLFGNDPRKADLFRTAVPQLLAEPDGFKRDMILSLLPDRIDREEWILKVDYKRIDEAHLMLVLTDITEERRLAGEVEREHLRLGMIVAAVTDRRNFLGAVKAYRAFACGGWRESLISLSAPIEAFRELFRQIHTYKGLFGQLSFAETPEALHRLEEKLQLLEESDAPLSAASIEALLRESPLETLIERDLAVLREALGEEFLRDGANAAPALLSLRRALSDHERTVSDAAARTGKQVNPLRIEGEDVEIDSVAYGRFLRSLVHIFRNSVAHGFGDEKAGTITCRITSHQNRIQLAIADDGKGLDLAGLRAKAVAIGLYTEAEAADLDDEEAATLIFRDRISTRDHSDGLSGRGVGLAAVWAETEALGGDVKVRSVPGEGTLFLFDLPR